MFDFNIDGDTLHCDLSWDHSISYYNDAPGADAEIYAWVKLLEKEPREGVPLEDIPHTEAAQDFVTSDNQGNIIDDCEGRAEGDNVLILNLDVAYNGTSSSPMLTRTLGNCFDADGDGVAEHHPVTLIDGRFYRLLANTGLNKDVDEVEVEINGFFVIAWSEVSAGFPMQRSDYREYVHDPNDPNREFDSGAAWFNGYNSVGGESGLFEVE